MGAALRSFGRWRLSIKLKLETTREAIAVASNEDYP